MLTLKKIDYHLLMVQMETMSKEMEEEKTGCFTCGCTSLGKPVDVFRKILGEEMTRLILSLAYYYKLVSDEKVTLRYLEEQKKKCFKIQHIYGCIGFEYVKEVLDELYGKGIIQIEKTDNR